MAAEPPICPRDLIALPKPDPRSALACAGLVMAAIGAIGPDGGLLWLVAGIWAVRAMAGTQVGIAWGLAVMVAGLRWGTLSLSEVLVATRIAGPTVLAGPVVVKLAMAVALAAALASEASVAGLRARGWAERAAAAIALGVLVPLYLVPGPSSSLAAAAAAWALGGAALTAATLLGRRLTDRLPAWSTDATALVAMMIAMVLA